jgi:ketosteroid isomerase-like protein
MSTLISTVQSMYAAFGRGDVPGILAHLSPDVSWEFEAPGETSWWRICSSSVTARWSGTSTSSTPGRLSRR